VIRLLRLSVERDRLYLAERRQPNPPLVPANLEDRILMFGYERNLRREQSRMVDG
jgi:hypothetical protein